MENLKLSNSVLEQLAFDLVGEMAEVAKHQAIIDNIKQIIVNEKTRVIKDYVKGKMFRFFNKKCIVLEVKPIKMEDGFMVLMTLAEEPKSATKNLKLTRKEAELLDQYFEYFDYSRHYFDEGWEKSTLAVANKLDKLKNNIRLVNTQFWSFDFDMAIEPSFFKETGITVGGRDSNGMLLTLEDVVIRDL
jgi:hypothetical protein